MRMDEGHDRDFLGFEIDSVRYTVRATQKKICKTRTAIERILTTVDTNNAIDLEDLQSVVGLLI